MKKNYDFLKMKGVKNPYIKNLTKEIKLDLDLDSIRYFQTLSCDIGIEYKTIINLYIKDCVASKRHINFKNKVL
jgi:hypothetical protein